MSVTEERALESGEIEQAKGYVDSRYLETVTQLLTQHKHLSYEMMHLERGHRVLDVGCGPGTDTIPMARLVGPTGMVMGIDHDPAMIQEADERARQAGVASWVRHQRADATSLPFERGTFDAAHCERMLQHLLAPEQAFSEMVRVVRSGGRFVAGEPDWGTFTIDVGDSLLVDVERRLARYNAERRKHNGYAGRQLFRLFRRHGLKDVGVHTVSGAITSLAVTRYIFGLDAAESEALRAGVITAEELQRWRTCLEEADAGAAFFSSWGAVWVEAEKP